MPNQFNVTFAEKLSAFIQSQIWNIMKHRIFVYINELEKRAIISIQNSENENAFKYAYMAHGIKEAIKVAERLSSEIMNGKFDVDGPLHVIEKKEGEERKRPWITKILGNRQNKNRKKPNR